MMGAVTEWLRQVMAAAFFMAALTALIPSGAVKRIAMLCCSLLLLLTLFGPFLRDKERLGDSLAAMKAEILAETAALETENREVWSALIEEELVSYIETRAAEEGLACTVRITLAPDENGVPLPVFADLTAPRRSDALQRCLEEELGLTEENIRWRIE